MLADVAGVKVGFCRIYEKVRSVASVQAAKLLGTQRRNSASLRYRLP
jgi:hypothetical protein